MIDVLKSHAPRKTMAMMSALATALGPTSIPAFAAGKTTRDADPATATPIKNLVVIFHENVSFDHYFGTYPVATNPSGQPRREAGKLFLDPSTGTRQGD